ncbi:STAS domain-containing protein [Kitasatospora sp. NPDC049285]|uniref:STAS domain-containing protein n=1 Tax=Kitasatospora sp. NPDC049285 TaxID=3157096 RepID=UPI003419ACAF
MPSDYCSVFIGPDLRIESRRAGQNTVCVLVGDAHMGNERQVRDALRAVLDGRPAVLAVDLAAVRLFTSSCLNALLSARLTARAAGTRLVLAAPSSGARRVLEITGADAVLPVYDTVAQALADNGTAPAP